MQWLKGFGVALAIAGAALGATAASADDGKFGGLYIGANIGWIGSNVDWTYRQVPNSNYQFSNDQSSGIWGGQIGIQHQFHNHFVLGVEAAYSGIGNLGGDDWGSHVCPNTAFNCQTRVDNVLTIGPRVGYALDHWLLFGTGGFASATVQSHGQSVSSPLLIEETTARHNGAFLGGGVEYAFSRSVILGLEYQHLFLGSSDACPNNAVNCATNPSRSLSADADIVRARLSFKLNRPEEHEESLK